MINRIYNIRAPVFLNLINSLRKRDKTCVMTCIYSYLQVKFYKRFDGAVSKTVVLKDSGNKVEGSSPMLRVRAPVKLFLFFFYFCFRKDAGFAGRHVLIYYAHIKRLHSLKWRSLYDAGAIIENVYKLCMEEKKSGM